MLSLEWISSTNMTYVKPLSLRPPKETPPTQSSGFLNPLSGIDIPTPSREAPKEEY
jgi:hypothetical protein